jgi:putative addiction module killer protein
MYSVIVYQDKQGKEPFSEWIEGLDIKAKDRVKERLVRIQGGNLGDYKNLDQGIFELRMFFDGGLRIYFGREGNEIILLLCGGNKKTQQRDIEKAKEYWKDYKNG